MKIRIKYILVILACTLLASACGERDHDSAQEETPKQESTKQDAKPEDSSSKKEETGSTEEKTDSPDAEKSIQVKLYSSNANADGFTAETVAVVSLSPESLIKLLAEKGSATEDTTVRKFEIVETEGKKSIEMDLSQSFATYVKNMGTSGEYYILGSVCNTFLEAYGCEQIKITIEGQPLTTGHAEYEGYMRVFE